MKAKYPSDYYEERFWSNATDEYKKGDIKLLREYYSARIDQKTTGKKHKSRATLEKKLEYVEIMKFFRTGDTLRILPSLIRELKEEHGGCDEKTLRGLFEYGMAQHMQASQRKMREEDSEVVMLEAIKRMEKHLGQFHRATLDSKFKFQCLKRKAYFLESRDWMRVEAHLDLRMCVGRGRYY